MTTDSMDKRARLETTLAGDLPDRVPVSLWRHWPGDDERIADFAQAVIDFQRTYGWDFVKVQPFSAYCVADYGVQTARDDSLTGDRPIVRRPVSRMKDWGDLRVLNVRQGELGKHLTALEMIREALPDVPVVTTLYSPFTQACMLAGRDFVLRHMRTHPEGMYNAFTHLTEAIMTYINEVRRRKIDGVFYVIGGADFELMSKEEYASIALPHDRRVIESFHESWWLNALELPGSAPMFDFAATYPLPVIHWNAADSQPDLAEARTRRMNGALAGGWSAEAQLYRGTPAIIQDVAREHLRITEGRRLILTAGGPLPVGTPLSNLRAARESVEPPRL